MRIFSLLFLVFVIFSCGESNNVISKKLFLKNELGFDRTIYLIYNKQKFTLNIHLYKKNNLISKTLIKNVNEIFLNTLLVKNAKFSLKQNQDEKGNFKKQRSYAKFDIITKGRDGIERKSWLTMFINSYDSLEWQTFDKIQSRDLKLENKAGIIDSINIKYDIDNGSIIIKKLKNVTNTQIISNVSNFNFEDISIIHNKILKMSYSVFGGSGVKFRYTSLYTINDCYIVNSLKLISYSLNKYQDPSTSFEIFEESDFNFDFINNPFRIHITEKFKIIKNDNETSSERNFTLNYDSVNSLFYTNFLMNKYFIDLKLNKYCYQNHEWYILSEKKSFELF